MENTNSQFDFSKLSESFQALITSPESTFQIFDMFPIPIEIFAPDGTAVFINRAFLDLNGIPDADLIVGKYNLKNDPVCNDQMGLREGIQRAFNGEAVSASEFSAPIQDLVDRQVIDEKPYESAFGDMFLTPVWNCGKLTYVICVFSVRRMYQGKPDVAKAKEYIDTHWLEEFDSKAVAKALNISHDHLRALFRQHTGMTMNDYYKKVKVDHIKEKLADKNRPISEVFDACGGDSRGWMARVFKEITGMSPKEYRDSLK